MATEIEVRFLEIDATQLKHKLAELGAEDKGEDLFDEIIYYDKDNTWQDQQKLVRVRKTNAGVRVAFKHNHTEAADGTHEAEFTANDFEQAQQFLESLGFLYRKRHQQKKRHAFVLDGVSVDIDSWPNIPTFVELEGVSEQDLQKVANKLGLDWNKRNMTNAAEVIKSYGIPVKEFSVYTFEKME